MLIIVLALKIVSASVESDFLNLVNQERKDSGKNPLIMNEDLTEVAYLHSKDMTENNYFSHTSLNGTTFGQRIKDTGYLNYYSLGKNIAYHYGSPDASKVFQMWKNNPGHYSNMILIFSPL